MIIAIYIYTLGLSLNNKYFYLKTQKKLFNILNKKKAIKISNLWNKKKIIILVK